MRSPEREVVMQGFCGYIRGKAPQKFNEPCGAMKDRWNCIDRRCSVQNNSWRIGEPCAFMFKADFYVTGKRIWSVTRNWLRSCAVSCERGVEL
jgi:hypothetical protein